MSVILVLFIFLVVVLLLTLSDTTLLTVISTLLIQVLVKSLFDRGFLFLLSSAQMIESKGAKKLFTLLS